MVGSEQRLDARGDSGSAAGRGADGQGDRQGPVRGQAPVGMVRHEARERGGVEWPMPRQTECHALRGHRN